MLASASTAYREVGSFIPQQSLTPSVPLTVAASLSSLQAGEEILGEVLTGEGALDEVAVEVLQNVGQVGETQRRTPSRIFLLRCSGTTRSFG